MKFGGNLGFGASVNISGERLNNASAIKQAKVRLYQPMRLQSLLERAGFRVNAIYGCYSGNRIFGKSEVTLISLFETDVTNLRNK
jgi:hypothetical protein